MSAADKREELEAAIWRRVHDSGARPVGLGREGMAEILAKADDYAAESAAEVVEGYINGRARDARARDRRDAVIEALAGLGPAVTRLALRAAHAAACTATVAVVLAVASLAVCRWCGNATVTP